MNRYYYDLHIHSCLSPCGDDDNTPNNIAGMAVISGLNIVALTDHNTTKNCPAFFEAAKKYGLIPVAGMELTTAEDIHVICLFETLAEAMQFGEEVEKHRLLFENRPDIFGKQQILDSEDNIIDEEKNLLSNATDLSLEDVPMLVEKFNGVCYPAHIDRAANGVISILGTFPETPHFNCVEMHFGKNVEKYKESYKLYDKLFIVSSDAHFLSDIRDKDNYFELEDEPYSTDFVRKQLFIKLKGTVI